MQNSTPTSQRLLAFKRSVREAILSGTSALPIATLEKVFDFGKLAIVRRQKQPLEICFKTVPTLVRLLEIVETSLDLIEKGEIITKRNLYYKLGKYYAGKYQQIDLDLDLLSFNTQLTKQELRVFSSSKCLLFGDLVLGHNGHPLTCNPRIITNVPLAESIGPAESNSKRLVIVEKESALCQMHQQMARMVKEGNKELQEIWTSTIFVSAKGYPDSTSRRVLETLLPLVQEIYYLGDDDIYGADILLCYSISSNGSTTFLPRVRWIQLQALAEALSLEPEVQLQTKEDRMKGVEMLQRPYLQDIEIFMPSTQEQQQFKDKLLVWKRRIKELQGGQFKVELQSFFKKLPQNWLQRVFSSRHWL